MTVYSIRKQIQTDVNRRNECKVLDRCNMKEVQGEHRLTIHIIESGVRLITRRSWGCAPVYVTVNKDEHGFPKEVFAALGNGGGCPSQSEATCRAVSAALRSGVDPRVLIEQLKGIRCVSTSVARKSGANVDVLSCPDAIARAIEEAIGDASKASPDVLSTGRPCPHCRRPMRKESGCFRCDHCQFDSCG